VNLFLTVILLFVPLAVGYFFYEFFLRKHFRLDDSRKAPAHTFRYGRDFEPTNKFYLLGQHLSAIACGACSGFHAIVASGTTSRQLNKEPDTMLFGYGGMLLESVLAQHPCFH